MPNEPNPAIGICPCPTCAEIAEVRQIRSRKRKDTPRNYLHCIVCGTHRASGAGFQEYILENATMYGASGAPTPPGETDLGPAPSTEVRPEPAPVQPVSDDNKTVFEGW